MVAVNIVIEGERIVIGKFEALDDAAFQGVKEEVIQLTDELEGLVAAGAPHGKTGGLAGSVHSIIRESAKRIAGIVTASVPYLPVIEFGIHKMLATRGYTRRASMVFGRDTMPFELTVGPYERAADVEATFFMEHALASMSSQARERLMAVVDAIAKATFE